MSLRQTFSSLILAVRGDPVISGLTNLEAPTAYSREAPGDCPFRPYVKRDGTVCTRTTTSISL